MDFRELFSLGGKTALVTGAGRGLGREISVGLAQYGASLVLADVTYPQETAQLVKQCGMRCLAIQTDISDERQVQDLTKMAGAEYRQVDILVNNAGVSQLSYTPSEDLPVDEWDRIVEINLRGTFLCCKHIGKSMIRCGGGSIVNIASTAGITGVARALAYCALKSGIMLLTKIFKTSGFYCSSTLEPLNPEPLNG